MSAPIRPPIRTSRPWRTNEVIFLREHAGLLTPAQIAARLDRTESAVLQAITRFKVRPLRPRWTSDERDALREQLLEWLAMLATTTGRTPSALLHQIREFGPAWVRPAP